MSIKAEAALKTLIDDVPLTAISQKRLAHIKKSYTTRRVPRDCARYLLSPAQPKSGDLVLARIERIGQHQHLELEDGRRAKLWLGDEVLVAYGNRYAPDQFEAHVPNDLGTCDLVAAGGIAARVQSQHVNMKSATRLTPIGLLSNEHRRPVNLADWRLPSALPAPTRPYTIAVLGTSMNAGKTTTAAGIIRGFAAHGIRVGAAKVTGTGAGGDRWAMLDAGASEFLDFTDLGHSSTAGLAQSQLEEILSNLAHHLALNGAQVCVLEIADGLLQSDTAALASSERFARAVDGIVFAANSAMGAMAGTKWLKERALPLFAVSGVITSSPLAKREAATACGLPTLTLPELSAGSWWKKLLPDVEARLR